MAVFDPETYGDPNVSSEIIVLKPPLHYNWHRTYDPMVGRYLEPDPIGQASDFNPYRYSFHDPVNVFDPDGLIPIDTLWDAGNVIYDIATRRWGDLAADVGALLTPYLPAGLTKLVKPIRAGLRACTAAKGGAQQFDDEQQALIDMAKRDKRTGISSGDAEAYKNLGKGSGVPVRGPEKHPGRPHGKEPHIHVGPVDHIPVFPEVH